MTYPLKVLHVTYSLKASGIETLVTNLHKYVDKEKVQFDFAVYCNPRVEEHYDNDVLAQGGCIHKLGIKNVNKSVKDIIRERINFFKLLKKEKYDIVHIHGSLGMHLIEAFFAKLNHIPNIIIHSHSSKLIKMNRYSHAKKILHYLFKWMWPYIATEFFTCSNEAAKWLFPTQITKLNKVKLLKNGIGVEQYIYSREKRKRIREDFSLNGKFVVGHVGRFSVIKNHTFLVDVFFEIYKLNPSAVLLLIGEGELEDTIKQKVSSLGLDNTVHFLGVRKDIPDILQAIDLIIFPSLFEGLPVFGIEAQAAGVPLVASDTISREMELTNNVMFLSLQKNPNVWAVKALNYYKKIERIDTSSIIKDKGFDIQLEAKKIEDFYIGLSGEKYESV